MGGRHQVLLRKYLQSTYPPARKDMVFSAAKNAKISILMFLNPSGNPEDTGHLRVDMMWSQAQAPTPLSQQQQKG